MRCTAKTKVSDRRYPEVHLAAVTQNARRDAERRGNPVQEQRGVTLVLDQTSQTEA